MRPAPYVCEMSKLFPGVNPALAQMLIAFVQSELALHGIIRVAMLHARTNVSEWHANEQTDILTRLILLGIACRHFFFSVVVHVYLCIFAGPH